MRPRARPATRERSPSTLAPLSTGASKSPWTSWSALTSVRFSGDVLATDSDMYDHLTARTASPAVATLPALPSSSARTTIRTANAAVERVPIAQGALRSPWSWRSWRPLQARAASLSVVCNQQASADYLPSRHRDAPSGGAIAARFACLVEGNNSGTPLNNDFISHQFEAVAIRNDCSVRGERDGRRRNLSVLCERQTAEEGRIVCREDRANEQEHSHHSAEEHRRLRLGCEVSVCRRVSPHNARLSVAAWRATESVSRGHYE